MAKEVYVGATSISKEKSAERAVKFVEDVTNGLRQGEKLSICRYKALKRMAKELLDSGNVTAEDYQQIIDKLDELRK